MTSLMVAWFCPPYVEQATGYPLSKVVALFDNSFNQSGRATLVASKYYTSTRPSAVLKGPPLPSSLRRSRRTAQLRTGVGGVETRSLDRRALQLCKWTSECLND